MLAKIMSHFSRSRTMKQTIDKLIDIIVKSQPMRPTANKVSDHFVIQYLKEMKTWDPSLFTLDLLMYEMFQLIKKSQNLVLFQEQREKLLQDPEISTSTELYQFMNRHQLETPYFHYVEYEGKYDFDARLTKLLQSEKNFVQSNNTDWETMLSFFGNFEQILQN